MLALVESAAKCTNANMLKLRPKLTLSMLESDSPDAARGSLTCVSAPGPVRLRAFRCHYCSFVFNRYIPHRTTSSVEAVIKAKLLYQFAAPQRQNRWGKYLPTSKTSGLRFGLLWVTVLYWSWHSRPLTFTLFWRKSIGKHAHRPKSQASSTKIQIRIMHFFNTFSYFKRDFKS